MSTGISEVEDRITAVLRPFAVSKAIRGVALLGLTAAYLQGGLVKALDFAGAVAEMNHFGLAPAAPLALLVIVLEIGASAMILGGLKRWAGAVALALFTVAATLVANRYWNMAGPERFMNANAFYEHLGLAGAFVLVACQDVAEKRGLARDVGAL
ncbi:DoxX family protein [Telmatospirillum sp.]|uniref:DoxX family protein n=1 Tax=Telmatospirillum sp. TaxID=2079197 RepID=UPI00284895B6|nr:DoxX family protein [Telmatospirillum sp.]MDR3435578.1 DoxX family protein [Telmatospirillum sp.]